APGAQCEMAAKTSRVTVEAAGIMECTMNSSIHGIAPRPTRRSVLAGLAALSISGCTGIGATRSDPLPSWNDGPNKQAIVRFVNEVSREGTPGFVPTPERIAVFDNDGTLWAEQGPRPAPGEVDAAPEPLAAVLRRAPNHLDPAAGARRLPELVFRCH